MEEHHYGGPTAGGKGGGGGGAQDPSAGSAAAAAARPNGWSSLTRLLRNPSPPPRDPFPPLLAPTTITSTSSAENHHAQNQNHVPSNSGERSQQQQQRGVSSPASSAGSFSSNHSGRNHQRNHHADAQAALSSNAAHQRGFLIAAPAGGSPPESSSGSFAPNSSVVTHHHHHHHHHQPKRDRHRDGNNNQSRGSAGPAPSAGSSLNPYPYRVQSGAYDAARPVGFKQQLGGSQDGGREREAPGGAKADMQVDRQENGYNSPSLKKREIYAYELVVDGGRRDENFAAAADAAARDGLDVKPAVSDGRSSIGDVDRDVSNGAHEQQGKDAGDSTAASSAFHVPMEPEWEEEDMYLRVRSDALKEARARDKFARGASQAYERGDHRKAKVLSKQAEEKRSVAQKLHAEAAAKILNQRNNEGSFDIWHLDLHGLHSSEAVAALESRLALLEHGLAEDHRLGVGSSAGPLEGGGQDQNVLLEQKAEFRDEAGGQRQQPGPKHKLFHSLIPTSKLLSVVTGELSGDGVGAHSHGGPTLPSAVKSFLINNGYQLEEARVGVVSVRPKLRFSNPEIKKMMSALSVEDAERM